MGKKDRPPPQRPQNAQLYSRVSYLYQAAALFALPPTSTSPPTHSSPDTTPSATAAPSPNAALSRFYVSTLRTVAAKSVLRIDRRIKRTLCKRCDVVLVPGVTAVHRVENNSRGGRKEWCDVLVVECTGCGAVKRFPVGMDGRKKVARGKVEEGKGGVEEKDTQSAEAGVVGKKEAKGKGKAEGKGKGKAVGGALKTQDEPEAGKEAEEETVANNVDAAKGADATKDVEAKDDTTMVDV